MKLSVIIPAYNTEEYISRCLDSLVNQTLRDMEIIVVNDGSTDNTLPILIKYQNNHNNIVVIDQENSGASVARNVGFNASKGKYIAFVDSDDFVDNDMYEVLYQKIETTNSDIVVCNFKEYISETDFRIFDVSKNRGDNLTVKEHPELIYLINASPWNKIYRRDLFEKNSISFPVGFRHQDLGTIPRLIMASENISFVDNAVYNYNYRRPNNVSQTYDKKLYHSMEMIKVNLDYARENRIFDEYYDALRDLTVLHIFYSFRKLGFFISFDFASKYIDDAFIFLKANFPDFRKTKCQDMTILHKFIYLYKFNLKIYIRRRFF